MRMPVFFCVKMTNTDSNIHYAQLIWRQEPEMSSENVNVTVAVAFVIIYFMHVLNESLY